MTIALKKPAMAAMTVACATLIPLDWSEQYGISLGPQSAQARVGRPFTPLSVAGVGRRAYRRAAYGYGAGFVGAGLVGAAALAGSYGYYGGSPYYGYAGYYGGYPGYYNSYAGYYGGYPGYYSSTSDYSAALGTGYYYGGHYGGWAW